MVSQWTPHCIAWRAPQPTMHAPPERVVYPSHHPSESLIGDLSAFGSCFSTDPLINNSRPCRFRSHGGRGCRAHARAPVRTRQTQSRPSRSLSCLASPGSRPRYSQVLLRSRDSDMDARRYGDGGPDAAPASSPTTSAPAHASSTLRRCASHCASSVWGTALA